MLYIVKQCKEEPELCQETVNSIEKARERIKRGNFCHRRRGKKKAWIVTYDLAYVPKNTAYDIEGNIKYFLICSPAFKKEQDISLE